MRHFVKCFVHKQIIYSHEHFITKWKEKKNEKRKKEIEILFQQPTVGEYTLDDLAMDVKTEDNTEPDHKE